MVTSSFLRPALSQYGACPGNEKPVEVVINHWEYPIYFSTVVVATTEVNKRNQAGKASRLWLETMIAPDRSDDCPQFPPHECIRYWAGSNSSRALIMWIYYLILLSHRNSDHQRRSSSRTFMLKRPCGVERWPLLTRKPVICGLTPAMVLFQSAFYVSVSRKFSSTEGSIAC